ncbi:MAG: nodulation protein NfeD, partial [Candidatus Competibacteraceae bacterium]|nr:nodulation protein NfeD [Candidatus Competibacteraceae bacterium]
ANDQAQNKPSGQSSDQSAQSDDTDPDEVLDRPPDESIDKPLSGSAMERKITNDARAYIRALAQLRGRNVEWAEQAVVQAASLSAQDALAKNVIDLVAVNVADLLTQLEGRTVQVAGTDRILNLDEPVIEILQPDWRNRLLAIITHPQVAYILMLLGIYGLFFELSNPGALIPGVLGGICLVLALFAFQVLPVNYAGLALIILGFGFMIAEAFVPSFGILGLGGVVAFITGSVILWDDQSGAFDVPLVLIIGFALASAVVFVGLGTLAWRSNRHPPVSGDAALLGTTATVLDTIPAHSTGWVRLHGESWRARNAQEQTLTAGETVRIRAREGLLLTVAPEDTHAA